MPSPLAKSLSQKLNLPLEKVESAWKKAKVAAATSLKKEVAALDGDDFTLVTNLTKRLLGVKEQINIVAFLKSEKSAKDFVEDMVSTGAGIGHTLDTVVIPPKKGRDDEDLSGGVGMYSDDEEDGPTPARVVTLTRSRRSPDNKDPDIYENHSKINMNDLSGGPNHGPSTGASERLAALAETVVPDKRFVVSSEKPAVVLLPVTRTAPITENRSRLDVGELNQLMSTTKPASLDGAMHKAPFRVAAVVEERSAPAPEDEENDRLMAEIQEDMLRMAETGVDDE
jgi:hypothetical protein